MPASGPIRILVVDDVETVHLVADRVLRKEGFDVVHVQNGRDAIAAVEQDPSIRLVILDIVMPEISGYDVMQRIVETIPKTTRPKVCFLSGLRNKDDVVKAISIGGDDYLVKPIDPDVLRIKVRTLLGLHAVKEFGSLDVSMRGRLLGTQIVPDIIVSEISETEVAARSTAAIASGLVIELQIATLASMTGWAHPFSLRVKDCRRQRHAVYLLHMEFVGLPEEVMQKVRSVVIRGEFVSDPQRASEDEE